MGPGFNGPSTRRLALDLTCSYLFSPNYTHVPHDTFYNGQNQQDSTECLLMLINIIRKGSLPDSNSTTYPMEGRHYMISCFHLFWKNILSAMYGDWGPPHLSLVVCYIFHLLIPLLCKTWFYKDCNRNCKKHVLDVIRTLGTSNQAIYYNLLNIYSLLIDLDTLILMSPKIYAPYLWIRPLDLVPLNLACGLLQIIMDRLYILVIILHG